MLFKKLIETNILTTPQKCVNMFVCVCACTYFNIKGMIVFPHLDIVNGYDVFLIKYITKPKNMFQFMNEIFHLFVLFGSKNLLWKRKLSTIQEYKLIDTYKA